MNDLSKDQHTVRITNLVMKPMKALWGGKFPDEMIDAFVDELSPYTDDVLDKTMKNLRRKSTKKPTLAVILQECEGQLAMASAPRRPSGTIIRRLSQDEIDRVMRGPLGNMAHTEGWWFQLYEFLELQANSEIVSADQIQECKRKFYEAPTDAELAAKIDRSPVQFLEIFRRMHDKFMVKHSTVFQRYFSHTA